MELSEEDKKRGKQAGMFLLEQEKIIPTNYGKATALVSEMYEQQVKLFEKGVEPTYEALAYFASQSLQIRKYLLLAQGDMYAQKELWTSVPARD